MNRRRNEFFGRTSTKLIGIGYKQDQSAAIQIANLWIGDCHGSRVFFSVCRHLHMSPPSRFHECRSSPQATVAVVSIGTSGVMRVASGSSTTDRSRNLECRQSFHRRPLAVFRTGNARPLGEIHRSGLGLVCANRVSLDGSSRRSGP